MKDVYLDVLIFENMVMNYVILHITSLVVPDCRWLGNRNAICDRVIVAQRILACLDWKNSAFCSDRTRYIFST